MYTTDTEQQQLDSTTLINLLGHQRAQEAVRAFVMKEAASILTASGCGYQIAVVEVSARNVKSRLEELSQKGTVSTSAGDMPSSIACVVAQISAHIAGERRIIALVSDPATATLVAGSLRDRNCGKGIGYEVWDVSKKPIHAHLGVGQLMYAFAPVYSKPTEEAA